MKKVFCAVFAAYFGLFFFVGSALGLKGPPAMFPKQGIVEEERYDKFSVNLPLKLNPKIQIEFWKSKSKEKRPTVIVLSILRGKWKDKIATMIAERIVDDMNYNVLLMSGERAFLDKDVSDKEELKQIMKLAAEATKERIETLELVMKTLEKEGLVQADNFGIVGISMGAIEGTVLCAKNSKIKSAVLIFGGQDIARILTEAQEPFLRKLRNKIIENCKISKEEFYEIAKKSFAEVEPAIFAKKWRKDEILLFEAIWDDTIPRESAEGLYESGGKPKRILVYGGHITSVFYYHYIMEETEKHLKLLNQ